MSTPMSDDGTWTLENGPLRLELSIRDERLWLALADRALGATWGPAPLLRLEVFEKYVERIETFDTYRIAEVEACDGALHVTVADDVREYAVGLFIRLVDGELSILLQPAELREHRPDLWRVFAAELLPGLMRCGPSGTLLLPIATGATCRPAGKPKTSDAFMVYGEQSRWELLPQMPACAAWDVQAGLIGLACQGAEETGFRIATDGEGGGQVGWAAVFRQHWPDQVENGLRELRYRPMPAGDDMVQAVARRLRRHIVGDLGKTTLQQRMAESPDVAYMVNAYIMKPYFGEQRQGGQYFSRQLRRDGSFNMQMTFAEAKDVMRRLHAAGIGRILTQSCGWIPRGHDGMYPTRFPIDQRLGGEAGFRELISYGNGLGYHMNVHDNFIDHYRASPDWDPEVVLQDIHGEPHIAGCWAGGVSHRGWPLAYSDAQLEGQMRAVKDLGLRGMFYVDGMCNPLYRNYHPRHHGTRTGYARGLERILTTAKRVFGSVGTECGFLYGSITSDLVVTHFGGSTKPSLPAAWPVSALADGYVPVWQLAMHGLTLVESHGHTWADAMRTILWGAHPRTQWSSRPGALYGTVSDPYIASLKAVYDLCLVRFGHLQVQELVSHRRLGPSQQETVFGDGTTVQADFATGELRVGGVHIPRPAALAG